MLEQDADEDKIFNLPVREKIGRMKYIPEEQMEEQLSIIEAELEEQMRGLSAREEGL